MKKPPDVDGFFSLGTRGSYLQHPLIFGTDVFAIDMASAIIMVFFACFIIRLSLISLSIPLVCGGIGLFSGRFMRQR